MRLYENKYNNPDGIYDNRPFNDVIEDIARKLKHKQLGEVRFIEGDYFGHGDDWDYEFSEIKMDYEDDNEYYSIQLDPQDINDADWTIHLWSNWNKKGWDVGYIEYDSDDGELSNIRCDIDATADKIYDIIMHGKENEMINDISEIIDDCEIEQALYDIFNKYDKKSVIAMVIAKLLKDTKLKVDDPLYFKILKYMEE